MNKKSKKRKLRPPLYRATPGKFPGWKKIRENEEEWLKMRG